MTDRERRVLAKAQRTLQWLAEERALQCQDSLQERLLFASGFLLGLIEALQAEAVSGTQEPPTPPQA